MEGTALGNVPYIAPRNQIASLDNQAAVNGGEEQQTALAATMEKVNQVYAAIGVKNLALKTALAPFLVVLGLVPAMFYGLYLMSSSKRFAAN